MSSQDDEVASLRAELAGVRAKLTASEAEVQRLRGLIEAHGTHSEDCKTVRDDKEFNVWLVENCNCWMSRAQAPALPVTGGCPECEAGGEVCEYHETHGLESKPFPWDTLPGYLIDHYEGETLTEELLQQAVAEMSRPSPSADQGQATSPTP